MILIKKEFKKGDIDLLEIYDNEFKILERSKSLLWNTDENHPIVIAKSRLNDYVSSMVASEKINDANEQES